MASKKTLFTNFSSLASVQVVNYIFPFITIPYITRVLGIELYGAVMFATAIAAYFTLFTDWGMNLYAPREISLIRDDKKKLSVLTSNLLYLKFASIIICSSIYIVTIFTLPQMKEERLLFLITVGYILFNGFNPTWFFQGIEKMGRIAIANLIFGISSISFIFILVRCKDDYIKLPIAYIIAGIISRTYILWSLFKKEQITLTSPDMQMIKKIMKEARHLFISNLSINIYMGMNIIILGFFTSNIFVGYYSLAEKIVKALIGIQSQISMVFYPHIVSNLKISFKKGEEAIKKGAAAVLFCAIPQSLSLFLSAEEIILMVAGKDFTGSVILLKMFSPLLIIVGLSNIAGVQVLLSFGKRKEFMNTVIIAGILNIALNITLIPYLHHVGAGLSFLISEIFVMIHMLNKVSRLNIKIAKCSTVKNMILLSLIMLSALFLLNLTGINIAITLSASLAIYVSAAIIFKIINLKERTINT